MSKSKIKKSVVFPIIMLAYLAVMAWIGRDRLNQGEYLYYFGIIGVGLVIILLLYLSLRKKSSYSSAAKSSNTAPTATTTRKNKTKIQKNNAL